MMIRRSQREYATRQQERQTLAKAVARSLPQGLRSAQSVAAPYKPELKKTVAVSNAASQDLLRKAMHAAGRILSEKGIGGVKLLQGGRVDILAALQGPQTNLIRSAVVLVKAETPTVVQGRVVSATFDLNLSFGDGRFSLDSFHRKGQMYPATKASLKRIAIDDPSGENEDFGVKEQETTPMAEPHDGDDANDDVRRHAQKGDGWEEKLEKFLAYPWKDTLAKEFVRLVKNKQSYGNIPFLKGYITSIAQDNAEVLAKAAPEFQQKLADLVKGAGRLKSNVEEKQAEKDNPGIKADDEKEKNSCKGKSECGGKRKSQGEYKFCFSVPTRDGKTYSVWKIGATEEEARKKLADEVGESFAERSKVTDKTVTKS